MRIRATRTGRTRTSWIDRRRAAKIKLRKQKELDKRELALADLELAKARDAYAEEKQDRAEAKHTSKTSAAHAAVTARWRAFRTRIANDRPLLAATIMALMCLVVAFVGQVMFYSSLPWPPVFLFMVVVLPVIVEGATWTFAINAEYLAGRRLPYAADTRKMWMFAFAAAAMNGYHGAVTLHEPITGSILGAASLVGPYIWHRYVTLKKIATAGRTAEQIRAALLRRIFHPVLWKRATDLWAAGDGALSPTMAWRITWMRAKGAAPGTQPVGELLPARNPMLFRLVFGRVVTGATPDAQPTATATGATATEPTATDDPPWWLTDDRVADALSTWAATPSDAAGATPSGGATPTAPQPGKRTSEEVAPPAAQPRAGRRNHAERNPAQQPGTAGATTAADLVAEYYRNQRERNVAPADISATKAAEYATEGGLQCSRQNADKVLRRLREREGLS